jgi:phospholipase C
MALKDIDTFVIVMLENRSFDHMCGYLSLPDADPTMPVEGLRDDANWLRSFENERSAGDFVPIHALTSTLQNMPDPPHEDSDIGPQITTKSRGTGSLGGFVKSYLNADPRPADPTPVMGYYKKDAVPVFDFFARNFAICDHWFSPLPAGTQPNRLMAMAGESHIHHNVADPLEFPDQQLVYDWLGAIPGHETKGYPLRWCAYQPGGLPFFSLMKRWWPHIMFGRNDLSQLGAFRYYMKFADHWKAGDDFIPDVVFIEPNYTDDPTARLNKPCDDHCPTGITEGQTFLAHIYNTLISNEDLWASTALIVTYDEHGGFFDHVPPIDAPVTAGGTGFKTTGVRVPAFVISPYVKPGSVFSNKVDSTAILHMLAERFTPGTSYSEAVAGRQKYLEPLSEIFDNAPSAVKPAPIPEAVLDALSHGAPAARHDTGEPTETAKAFDRVVTAMAKLHPDQYLDPYPAGTTI